jgi:hypothetical protein
MARSTSIQQAWLFVVAVAAIMAATAGAGALALRREADRPAEDAPPPPPPEALAQATPELDLPVSTSNAMDHAPDAVSVIVARRRLLVGGDPNPIAVFPQGVAALAATGLPARFKRDGASDFLVPDLGNELAYFFEQSKALGVKPAFALLADASTPYRVVSEILRTADASSRFERIDLAVRGREAHLAWLALPLPQLEINEVWRGPTPELSLTDDGFSIRWSRGKPAPGCAPEAGGTRLPKVAGAYDVGGLAECLRRVKREAPYLSHETRLALHVSPAVDWQTVVSAIDAALGTDEGGLFFPEITFAGDPRARSAFEELGEVNALADSGGWVEGSIATPSGSGAASIGGAAVSGGSVTNASSVVAGMHAGFRRCFNKGLRDDPKMKGTIRLTARIGPAGEVISVSPVGSGLSAAVISCVAARVSSAQFAPPEGGSTTIVIPVTLVPQ